MLIGFIGETVDDANQRHRHGSLPYHVSSPMVIGFFDKGVTDVAGQGFVDGADLGKMTILPSSHIGGRHYLMENFQHGLAVCRVHGAPDIFYTFTCNPKWPEIIEPLLLEPGQRAVDRAGIIVRVYKTKLDEYIDDIKSGRVYGPVKAVQYTVEFQTRGVPHAHILIWLKQNEYEVKPDLVDVVKDPVTDLEPTVGPALVPNKDGP